MSSAEKPRDKICTIKSHKMAWFIILWLGGLFTSLGIAYSIRLILKIIV